MNLTLRRLEKIALFEKIGTHYSYTQLINIIPPHFSWTVVYSKSVDAKRLFLSEVSWCQNCFVCAFLCVFLQFFIGSAILIAHQIVMAKHGGSCVHFSGISTCGRTSRETVAHPQCPPLPTLCNISLPIYVIVTNILLQPLTTTWYDSLVLSISLLKI